MNTQHAVMDLVSIINDPESTRLERDVARRVKADVAAGWVPARDHLDVLRMYLDKRQQQDRYGK